jgi:hypothetical protein
VQTLLDCGTADDVAQAEAAVDRLASPSAPRFVPL